MYKKDLREFNPEEIAEIETAMWRAYYNRQFFKLFRIFLRMMRVQFGLDRFSSFVASYYFSTAMVMFKRYQGEKNKERIEEKLIYFFGIISTHCTNPFDKREAGKAEALWYYVDRYPDRYTLTREEGIRNVSAIMYHIPSERLNEYGILRAKAMVLLDGLRGKEEQGDWVQVESLLIQSYRALHLAVQG